MMTKLPANTPRRRIASAALLAAACGSFVTHAGPFSTQETPEELVKPRLVLETDGLHRGGATYLGVIFEIAPEWHIYWRNPGDTGMPPAISLDLPDGVAAGEPMWPAPAWYEHTGLLDFIYEDEVMLIIPLYVERDAPLSERVRIHAAMDWLVCKDVCLPGDAEATLWTRITDAAPPAADETIAARFRSTRSRFPSSPDAAERAGIVTGWSGRTLTISAPGAEELRWFPYAPDGAPPENLLRDGRVMGRTLNIEYDNRIDGSPLVAGVLEVRRDDGSERYTIELSGPPE